MKRFPFRPVMAGVLIGATLFFAPFFLLRAALFVLIIGSLFRFFGRGRWHRMQRYGAHYSYDHAPLDTHVINLRSRDVQGINID